MEWVSFADKYKGGCSNVERSCPEPLPEQASFKVGSLVK